MMMMIHPLEFSIFRHQTREEEEEDRPSQATTRTGMGKTCVFIVGIKSGVGMCGG